MAVMIGRGTRTFLKDDSIVVICPPGIDVSKYKDLPELMGIRSINIKINIEEVITADIEIFSDFVETEAVPRYMIIDPRTNKLEEVKKIELINVPDWEPNS